MLIQNVSRAASAPGLTSDSAPAPVAAHQTRAASADLPQAAAQLPVKATATDGQQPSAPTSAQIQNAVDNINRAMKQSNANVEFSIDKETMQTVIRVVESRTGQVIRQFPSEEVLAISHAIDQMQQRGLLLKQEA